jgi:HEXXH motif-containing protein
VEIARQETVPGTSILLAHRLFSSARGLRVGGPLPGLGARLSRTLDLVDGAWPRAGREIRRRTWLIVPLVEPGTVSYSHLARPGISYLSVFRGSLVDLADDLLHETAHHRLHAMQEVKSLIRDPGEHRFYSPWRRSMRPLNGILHGTFTFLYRAELFRRLSLGSPRPAGARLSAAARRRLASEARRELKRCAAGLADLREASRGGRLTSAGRRLVARMGRRWRALEKGRLSGKRGSIIL